MILINKTYHINYDPNLADIYINTRDIRLLGPYLYYKRSSIYYYRIFMIKIINKYFFSFEMNKD